MGKASISIAVSGSYNGSALEKAQRQLERLEVRAASMGDSVASSMAKAGGEMGDLGGAIHDLGYRAESAGQSLIAGLAAPIAAAGAGAILAAADFDSASSSIEAACGGATEEAEALKDAGRTLYTDGWGDSMPQLADSLVRAREILGDLSETDMTYAVEGALTLERVYGSDFAESLRGVNALMDNFGLSATEATDLMVSGTQRGLDYTKELGDNISEYSGRWADAGMSASTYFSLLEAGAQNGAYQLDKVGDFLNEFLTSLSDGRMEDGIASFSEGTQETFRAFQEGGATAQDVLDAVVGELARMPDSYEQASIASELWSSLGEDNALSMITALAGVEDTFTDAAGSAQQAGDEIADSLEVKAAQAVRTAQEALEPFAGAAVDLLGEAADVAKGAAQGFSELDEGTQTLIVGAAGLAAAAGPVLTVGGKIAEKTGDLVAAFGKARQQAAVYADAMTTADASSLKLYESDKKLSKALDKNPFAKAAGGVSQYIEAVEAAEAASGEYRTAVKKLERETAKGADASADAVRALQDEVAARKGAMEAANGTVDSYKAQASAAKTSTAAVKLSATGMQAFAAATNVAKTALATFGPMLAVTAVVAFADAVGKARERQENLKTATDGLVAAASAGITASEDGASALEAYGGSAQVAKVDVDALLESQSQLAQSIADTNTEASAQMGQLSSAYSTIQQYANHSGLLADEQARLRAAVETVNTMCGTQIEVTDAVNGILSDENGVLEDVTASLGDYITQKMEQIRVDAQQQNLTSLYQQQAENIEAVAQAQASLIEKYGTKQQFIESEMKWPGMTLEAAEAAWQMTLASTEEGKALSTTQQALESTNAAIDILETSLVNSAALADGSAQSISGLASSSSAVATALTGVGGDLGAFSAAVSDAGVSVTLFRELSEGELAVLAGSFDGTSQSILDALEQMGYGMQDRGLSAVTSLANGMQAGTVSVEAATAIVQAAATGDWSSVSSQLSAAGVSIPQSVADGITANGFAASDATNQMLSSVALVLTGGDVKAAANLLGHDIDAGLAQGIMEGTLSEEQSAMLGQDVIDAARTALESHSPSQAMLRVGQDVDAGLAQGISGDSSGPLGAIGELGRSLVEALAGVPGEMGQRGSQASQGLSSGLSSGTGSVSSSATSLYAAASDGTRGVPSLLSGYATDASARYAAGLMSSVGSARSSASAMASAAAGMQNAGNSYTWGSHLSSNFASGIRAGLGWVSSAASAIASAARSILGFSVPEEGPWSGSERGGVTSGLHLAQNFARGMEMGASAVEDASADLARASYFEASTGYAGMPGRVRTANAAAGSEARTYDALLGEIASLLREIASKELTATVGIDGISAALARSSRTTARGRGVAA